MRKLIKSAINFIMCISLISSNLVYASDGVTSSVTNKLTLSLSDSIKLSLDNSSELIVCDVNKETIRKQIKEAAQSQKDMRNIPINVTTSFDAVFVKNGYYVRMFNSYLNIADLEKEKVKASITYDTINKYYTYKSALKVLDLSKQGLDRALQNIEIVNQKYSLGMCTHLEVKNASIAYKESLLNFETAKQNAELSKDALKIRLGIDDNVGFDLKDDIDISNVIYPVSLEEDTKKALVKRYDVKALNVNYDLSKDYHNTSGLLDEEGSSYLSAYKSMIEAKNNLENGVKNISLLIKSAYFDVLNTKMALDIAREKLDYTKTEYETFKLRFEMGMITNNILSAKSQELTSVEIAYQNALLKHKLSCEKYNYEITIGL